MQLKLLNRIATVKDDGTVEFEIPSDVEPSAYGNGSGKVQSLRDEDTVDSGEPRYFPPLQIVMLIVGTRGDVQPFVAIGKRLQVSESFFLSSSCINCFEHCENLCATSVTGLVTYNF